jgi:hypothetical protein
VYLRHKEINVSSSTFERKIVVFVGGGRMRRISSYIARSMRMRVLGFIGFSCAAQCFLCVFYPIFNDNFGKWVLTRTFLCLLLLHFSSSGVGVRDENAANYFNNVCKHFFRSLTISPHIRSEICTHGLFMEYQTNLHLTGVRGMTEIFRIFFQFQSVYSIVMYDYECYGFKGWIFLIKFLKM